MNLFLPSALSFVCESSIYFVFIEEPDTFEENHPEVIYLRNKEFTICYKEVWVCMNINQNLKSSL